ncbi:MAG: hypothetical protein FWD57_15070 [Polyangiaceae bacterium]|nr:hypothetical protein [Polyangiaceae bacterium]
MRLSTDDGDASAFDLLAAKKSSSDLLAENHRLPRDCSEDSVRQAPKWDYGV